MPPAFDEALARRRDLISRLHAEDTDVYRLWHGVAEGSPGLTVDRYGPVLLVQTWREPLDAAALAALVEPARAAVGAPLIPVYNHRGRGRGAGFDAFHTVAPFDAVGREQGLRFDVSPRHRGQDPLLFLDLRVLRRRVRSFARGRSVLNLFAYTCGLGCAAAVGGASEVWNVDFASSSLDVGRKNATLNDVSMTFVHEDCLPVMRQLAGLRPGRLPPPTQRSARTFDLVMLDPPALSKGRWGVVDVVRDTPSLFKPAVLASAPGGVVVITNHVASVDRDAWLEQLVACARKAGRPLGDVALLTPEADFPSFDGKPPLKIAWCTVP